uniref:Uncharacterized protein n=1 Tax=Heterorhabditis bacteriophora TaxID=37862 RepID=A0A1I7X8X4_HETBA
MSMRSSSTDCKGIERPSIHGPGPPPSKTLNSVQAPIRHDRNYKLIQDTFLGAKETIRRYDGHIPGHPKVYNK